MKRTLLTIIAIIVITCVIAGAWWYENQNKQIPKDVIALKGIKISQNPPGP